MPKKQYTTLSDVLNIHKGDFNNSMVSNKYIPNVIEFCESPEYLGLKKYDSEGNIIFDLYPMQRIILKIFYRGSIGNETLELTEEEIQLCKECGLDTNEYGDALDKYYTDNVFRELVLVWGRRSGKTFLFSIIALYEAMRLLEISGGDPYKFYNLGSGAEISILTVAMSSDQARLAFREISEKLLNSKYFSDKFKAEGIGSDYIYLLTPQDRKDNQKRKKKKVSEKKGSIKIEVGHSNSSTLRGKSIFVLLFDEIASYTSISGSSSDENLYTALEPSVNTFFRTIVEKDENGDKKERKIFDGKIVCISSPMGKEGKLYRLYNESPDKNNRVSCRLPTWKVTPSLTKQDLRETSDLSDERFMQEYGAEFSGLAGRSFFPLGCIEKMASQGRGKKFVDIGRPGIIYFAHLDPASTSHNYALVIVHKETFLNKDTKSVDYRIVVDHIKYWQPSIGKPIKTDEVDEYVISLRNKFFFGMVTYDQWNSTDSIEKLKKFGIPSKCTKFNNKYIMTIYDELYNLIIGEKLVMPYHDLLIKELKNLQRKPTLNGYRRLPKPDGPVDTDDICVHPDTIIFTEDGPKKIVDVFPGEKVLTHKGKFKKITDKSCHFPKAKQKIYNLQPYYGFSLIATDNHQVEILRNGEKKWESIQNINVKTDKVIKTFNKEQKDFYLDLIDFVDTENRKHQKCDDWLKIAHIRCKNANGKWHKRIITPSYNLGYIYGLFIAEGSIGDHSINFAGNIEEPDIYNKIKQISNDEFGIDATKRYLSDTQSKGINYYINSQILKNMFIYLFKRKKATDKYIPNMFMVAKHNFQKGLLNGMFDGDGSHNESCISFTTTSEYLAHQIQQILLRFKVISSISCSKRKNKIIRIRGRLAKHNSDLYNVRITDAKSFNILSNIFNLDLRKKQSKYHKPRYIFFNNYVACNIKKLEISNYRNFVVNLAVQRNNSYVSGSINSHNCDALAGACYNVINMTANSFPRGKLVNIGVSPMSNSRMWRSMSGQLGYGTGQQVSAALERIRSWPDSQRR